ncbi:GNAT family N-acetyltransferase [Bacteroidota bacterium]
MTFTKISSERLILEPLSKEDAQAMLNYRSLPEVYKYQGWQPENVDDAEKFILKHNTMESGGWMQLAIRLREDGKLIGDCGMHFIDDEFKQIEIGFSLSPVFQGKGYATEAVSCLLDYIFTTLRSHRVYGSCDPDNLSSIKLMTRIGMRKEAHLKESIWFKGRWADDVICAILDHEWQKRK